MQQEKFKQWPQAHLHTQWPGSGEIDDPTTRQIIGSFLPEISFPQSVPITHEAMLALADRIGPFIVLMHSQGGPVGWAIADARPDLVKAVIAVEPNGPPGRTLQFVGAPEWFKDGPIELPYGLTPTPITYAPPLKDPSELKWVREDMADGPDLASLRQARDRAEREALVDALVKTRGNISQAAKLLGVSRPTFHGLIAKCEVNARDFR